MRWLRAFAAKDALRRFITKWEVPFYAVTGALYLAALLLTWWLFPGVDNLTLQLTILLTGLTATIAAAAGAIKASGKATTPRLLPATRVDFVAYTGETLQMIVTHVQAHGNGIVTAELQDQASYLRDRTL